MCAEKCGGGVGDMTGGKEGACKLVGVLTVLPESLVGVLSVWGAYHRSCSCNSVDSVDFVAELA